MKASIEITWRQELKLLPHEGFLFHNKQKSCVCIDPVVDIRPNVTLFEQKFRKVLQTNTIFLLLILFLLRRNDFSLYRNSWYRKDRKPSQNVASFLPHSEIKTIAIKPIHATLKRTFPLRPNKVIAPGPGLSLL